MFSNPPDKVRCDDEAKRLPSVAAPVSDIFKIGIGPSSSHTVGPMVAARRFVHSLPANCVKRLIATAFGSLAWTGKGHATDVAMILGMAGYEPKQLDPDAVNDILRDIALSCQLRLPDGCVISFDPQRDVIFDKKQKFERHPNAMRFQALDHDDAVLADEMFYSIGGGLVTGEHAEARHETYVVPFSFATAAELLEHCEKNQKSIGDLVLANELCRQPADEIHEQLDEIIDVMMSCIDRGISQTGTLPGGLQVPRRANTLYAQLRKEAEVGTRPPGFTDMEYVSVFAIAVNEENASGGRVVTAPTNGAAGVIPAVLRFYRDFCKGSSREGMRTFLLTATAVGGLIKGNASISGAEVGCQGEVGSAASMAAAGLAAALGATPRQTENAAEIAMEHHLGMTCDPIGGLVQIPCIERNAFGAVKAINAARLALRGDGTHHVTLDQVIKTMWETGRDMKTKYKETSRGGLAINVPNC
ncbi:L-serine ammonia-lyase [Agrobacterium sp. LAD9]|uniref:L-serine ammonia-lyase n=1 Tax=Agrobacterium sp. LAD9 TaxID=2055153 RepID=UPI000D1EA5A9|nr:L-serine ammonia-lyase [Agrobacterium sp. LAD9]